MTLPSLPVAVDRRRAARCRRRASRRRPVRQARGRDQVPQGRVHRDGHPLRPRRRDGQRARPVRRQGRRRQRRDRDRSSPSCRTPASSRAPTRARPRPSRRSGPRWTSSTPPPRRCRKRWPSSTCAAKGGNIDADQGRRRRDRQELQGLPRRLPQGVTLRVRAPLSRTPGRRRRRPAERPPVR